MLLAFSSQLIFFTLFSKMCSPPSLEKLAFRLWTAAFWFKMFTFCAPGPKGKPMFWALCSFVSPLYSLGLCFIRFSRPSKVCLPLVTCAFLTSRPHQPKHLYARHPCLLLIAHFSFLIPHCSLLLAHCSLPGPAECAKRLNHGAVSFELTCLHLRLSSLNLSPGVPNRATLKS